MAACMSRMSRLEEGSGTMAGVMLVMLVGVALSATACIGNLVVCQNRARSLADLIAFDAAYAAWHGWAD
ncbi:flp pilus-assembly TadE/G-like family protein, partial [Lactobacillus crispatus]